MVAQDRTRLIVDPVWGRAFGLYPPFLNSQEINLISIKKSLDAELDIFCENSIGQ